MSKIDDEKSHDLATSLEVPAGHETVSKHGNIVDLAARAHVEDVQYDEAESRAVLRRIDWHLMPLLVWICEQCMCELLRAIALTQPKTAYSTPTSRR